MVNEAAEGVSDGLLVTDALDEAPERGVAGERGVGGAGGKVAASGAAGQQEGEEQEGEAFHGLDPGARGTGMGMFQQVIRPCRRGFVNANWHKLTILAHARCGTDKRIDVSA